MNRLLVGLAGAALLAPAALGLDLAAFDAAGPGTRSSAAQVVPRLNGYFGVVTDELRIVCTNPVAEWGGKVVRLTNNSTSSLLAVTVLETADPTNFASHTVDDATLLQGETANVTLTLDKLAHPTCHDDVHTVTYRVEGEDTANLRAVVPNVVVTIRFHVV